MARQILLIVAVAIVATSPAMAQSRAPEAPKARRTPPPTKPAAANPCAQLGAEFVRIEGSDTCVKIGGSMSVGAGASR